MREWFDCRITAVTFYWETTIRPLFAHKYYGYAYDWMEKCVRQCWWIKDRHNKWIPWAHFDNDSIMCCTPDTAFFLMGEDVEYAVNE